MQQLTGLDQMFVSLDNSTTNAVLGGLVLLERPEGDERAADAAVMRERFAERLDALPPLRWCLKKVPLALDHSYLAEPDRIDVGAHVRSISLPAPGTHEQLASEVSRIMSTSLVPDRPMWDYTVIEGLEDGRVAHLLRIHHGVIDGSSLPAFWDALADKPTEASYAPVPRPTRAEPVGGSAELLVRGLLGTVTRPVKQVGELATFARWLVGKVSSDGALAPAALALRLVPGELARPLTALVNPRLRAKGQAEVRPYLPTLRPPSTPFNGRISSRRTFDFAHLPLADVKAVGKANGASINDVVLAMSAGALRRYLEERGGVPEQPLIVCVPVSLRTGDEKTQWGNQVHMIFAPLPTHVADPLERLRMASSEITAAKRSFDELPTRQIRSASRFLPRDFLTVPVQLSAKVPGAAFRMPWNVVVSNVKGPRSEMHMGGARIDGVWPASFLSVGGGINIGLQSYVDRICFGFMGTPEQVGDISPLTRYLADALDELIAATAAEAAEAADTPVEPAESDRRMTRLRRAGS